MSTRSSGGTVPRTCPARTSGTPPGRRGPPPCRAAEARRGPRRRGSRPGGRGRGSEEPTAPRGPRSPAPARRRAIAPAPRRGTARAARPAAAGRRSRCRLNGWLFAAPDGDLVLRHGRPLAGRLARIHGVERGVAPPVVVLVLEEHEHERLLPVGVVEQDDLGRRDLLRALVFLELPGELADPVSVDALERHRACVCHIFLPCRLAPAYAVSLRARDFPGFVSNRI